MVNAMANSTVPKITIVVGNSYGSGNYAMCGRAYDPRFMYAWPTANIAVMSGASAGKTLTQIQIATLKKKGQELSEEEQTKLQKEITHRYNKQTDVRYAAARLWIDGIIHPAQTRERISKAIEVANLNSDIPDYKTGVIQV